MDPKCSIFSLLILSFVLLFSHATAFNITKLLGQFPEFSNFSDLLTQAHLVGEINSRQTITILAVDNSAISAIAGKPADKLKRILSLHVVLDYYDPQKLHKLSKKTALFTTLFQSSGEAIGRLGFLNCTILPDGHIAFGSAVRGSTLDSKFVQLVASQPYNISVLQISAPIDPQSIETLQLPNNTASPSAAPAHSPKASKSKRPSKAPVEAPAPSDDAEAPVADDSISAAPTDAPSDAPAPEASDVPTKSPPALVADGPDADAPSKSNSSPSKVRTVGSFMGLVVIGVASWFAL